MGLRNSDARVRRVCVEELGKFAGEATVVSTLKELLQRGDPSYAVQAKALVAYAKMGQKDAVTLIKPWLSQPSHDDKLAIAALSALGIAGDQTAFQLLLEWTEPSHSFDARFAAREALVLLGMNQHLTEEQSQQVVANLRLAREQSEGSDRERIDDMIKRTLQKTGATAKPNLQRRRREGGLYTMLVNAAFIFGFAAWRIRGADSARAGQRPAAPADGLDPPQRLLHRVQDQGGGEPGISGAPIAGNS